ncbi:hypothetical protein [Pelomonas cellulosilytica]|uniref:Uncharacterized protein n=1 Tax=Pelomonas cellulosilytica TaxID=2906762 RepID=A0ABS8XPH7_9BURK|nr:hypothetical protein [Pelomonas sp. P8]MCE4554664.1 hypothetical protein [Pelomonas sp. P8]
MKLREWLDAWSLKGLKIHAGFLDAEFAPNDQDADAAWELYVELLTRATTQLLPQDAGDEAAALESVHDLFGLTRAILRAPGRRHATGFAKIAIVVLNQKVRPFTAKWHKLQLAGLLDKPDMRADFRSELTALQVDLRHYAGLLSQMAGVEDLTTLQSS